MDQTDELRLIVPPGLAPRLRVHPLLQVPPGGTGVFFDITDHEIRLVSRHAGRGKLLRVAAALADAVPLQLKLANHGSRDAGDLELSGELPVGCAMRKVFHETLGHLMDNVGSAHAGDVEGVHQARVGVRRLRSAIRLFRPHLRRSDADRFDAQLRRLGRVLGATRDWDVLLLDTLPLMKDAPALDGARRKLGEPANGARIATQRSLASSLEAAPFAQLSLGLSLWIEEGPADGELPRLGDAAPILLDRMAHRVSRRGHNLAAASAEDLHSLRKSLKKLRYSVEFVASLFGTKRAKAYLHSLKALQSDLGSINDIHMCCELVAQLSPGPVEHAVSQWADNRLAAAQAALLPLWEQFSAQVVPWRN